MVAVSALKQVMWGWEVLGELLLLLLLPVKKKKSKVSRGESR
jgi:hypothetical protein